jgi:hypothetical protein
MEYPQGANSFIREQNRGLPNFRRSTLHMLMKDIDFTFVTSRRKIILTERSDILLWRQKYLGQTQCFRSGNCKIHFLHEIWVSVGHTTKA